MGTNKQEHLDPLAFTRLKPGVYCGNCAYSTQLLIEAFSNSFDELYRLKRKNSSFKGKINVNIDGSKVEIEDNGDGFNINSKMEDGTTELECAFSKINTSGKYREDGTYEGISLGNFGIGAKLPNFLSHNANVMSVRDGMYEHIWFVEGVFDRREVGKTKSGNGTQYIWNPSEEFFKDTRVEVSMIRKYLRTEACLCPGIEINLTIDGKSETFLSKNGLVELLNEELNDTEIIKNRLLISDNDGKYQLDLAMTYTTNYSSTIIPYVNTGLTNTGDHIKNLKATLTREMNKFFKSKKWLKETDSNLTGDDIAEGLYIIFNYTAPNVKYDAQVKSNVTDIDTKFLTSSFADSLNKWATNNEKELKAIVDKALTARKAREAAKKARDAARNGGKKEKKAKIANLPTKLIDCKENGLNAEIHICEGDSAASGLVEGRDGTYQAIFPIRGKMINALKNNSDKVMANQEVNNLIKALGLQMGANGKLIYDIKKLRYGKIIAATDGDPDGQNIRMLIAVNLWNLCPELILNGHFYIAYAPLFRITTSKNKYIYIKDTAELEKYKSEHIGEKYLVNRMKGLGECDANELAEVLLEEKTRNIKQVVVSDFNKANAHLEMLMGTAVAPRREFLLKNGERANNLYENAGGEIKND